MLKCRTSYNMSSHSQVDMIVITRVNTDQTGGQRYLSGAGMSDFGQKLARLAPNGTIRGLFQIRFQI